MRLVVHALLTCSEDECTDVYEAYGSLEQVEALACECGCGLAIIGRPDASDDVGPSVDLVELVPLAA